MKNNLVEFLLRRRSVTAKNMLPTEIDEEHLSKILEAGMRVPDHGALTPWKIVIFKKEARLKFGKEIIATAFRKANPKALPKDIKYEENRFTRAGIVICVISCPIDHKKIPAWEMQLSSAAVCSNLLISAQSLGYASQWLTEWYAYDKYVMDSVGANSDNDQIAGFIYIGKQQDKPKERIRPLPNKIVNNWL